jgi:hypothetical protein
MDRRDPLRRRQVISFVVDHLVQSVDQTVTIDSLRDLLKIPEDGAHRIIGNLVRAGILQERSAGVWCSAAHAWQSGAKTVNRIRG